LKKIFEIVAVSPTTKKSKRNMNSNQRMSSPEQQAALLFQALLGNSIKLPGQAAASGSGSGSESGSGSGSMLKDIFGSYQKKDSLILFDDTFIKGCDPSHLDFYEYPTCYELHMDLPGVNKSDIDLKIVDGFLIIQAIRSARSDMNDPKNVHCVIAERGDYKAPLTFGRKLKLNSPVIPSECVHFYEDGVLSLTIPKMKPESPKEIKIPLQ
jgi:HSP20 family protein